MIYLECEGVPQDYAEALKWYRKAADQGDAGAQRNLGLMYSFGKGLAKDKVEAVKWYRKAAEQGDSEGQGLLAAMYERGIGVPQDYIEAYQWFNLSAASGSTNSAVYRDRVQSKMTFEQIAEGQKRAREFAPRKSLNK